MSTPKTNIADRILQILTTINTTGPIAVGGVAALLAIFQKQGATGKTDAEIQAEWNDSMETALRTREKQKQQQGDQA